MNGARHYANLFKTGQHGKLYFVVSKHARGKTFRIFILPENEKAIENENNAPLNKDSVEVFGVIGGQLGWTEYYGWIYKGKWVHDFELLVNHREEEILKAKEEQANKLAKERIIRDKINRELLSNY